ncbi:hydroxymethylpyrimidine/phosphomethylpyrimidine kinase [Anaerobranca californiensis DSM 14826]|jgi:hydroxymethylpyrimidine/phosphomethylpyrimidine kinase|uniref:Hydroxymethylpyrimidine/phosphomethylpyrimidine kinase n=1 Tax=Anaerobranca californiensis DSM 14826 TaxID=1120989 RepID=A0A1M6QGB3_9FIRM|nr:bifunctional hydroxymethylpyrimidine kinase/phosphomethylpyrimidine kinase [Anaerobranca californiensis]SHK19218.1 hydroxymethylpyrimidine/phosphomethylpyrimidine kinase [Anaerobranca californiensis DSM 14826]
MKKLLTIAGSDSSGGAGIQADLKTFSSLGTYGMSVITAITAQNTQGVFGVQDIDEEVVYKQIEAIFSDIEVDGVKIGMVSKSSTIEIIVSALKKFKAKNIVVDPVMVSKSGYHLLQREAKKALIEQLLPIATIVTPNLFEAEEITGLTIKDIKDMEKAGEIIHQMGPRFVLVKGGHLSEKPIDVLYDGEKFKYYEAERVNTKSTHGTGCTLSSAIAVYLAKGYQVDEGVKKAKEYITQALINAFPLGKGTGPVHHFYSWW